MHGCERYIHCTEQQWKSLLCIHATCISFFFTELAGGDINDEAERMVNA